MGGGPVAKPRIGITRSGSAERIAASYQSYHERVRESGGEPVDLHPAIGTPPGELIERLDGLLLTGGPDVAPRRGAGPEPRLRGRGAGRAGARSAGRGAPPGLARAGDLPRRAGAQRRFWRRADPAHRR